MREFRRTNYKIKEIEQGVPAWVFVLLAMIIVAIIAIPIIIAHTRGNNSDSVDSFEVARIVDGDTIDIKTDNGTASVRLIGINAPEVSHGESKGECFGDESTSHLEQLIGGSEITLEYDESQGRYDKYNRILAYIYVGNDNINYQMIRDGYAREYTYETPYKYKNDFVKAGDSAAEEKLGIWANNICVEESAPTTIAEPEPVANQPSIVEPQQTEELCLIKGNISYYGGKKIYHVPGQKYYSVTQINEAAGERWFCTEEEAIAAGWRKSKE